MFSKKPQFAVQSVAPAPAAPFLTRLTNPYVAAVGAGVLLLGSLGVLVATGDPRAGAPSVRVALGAGGATDVAQESGAVSGEFSPDDIVMAPMNGAPMTENPYGGDAVITMADGSQKVIPMGGGSDQALPAAPIAGLSQPAPGGGMLPMIGADGRTPAQAYARPFTSNGKPKVAIVIGGLGLDPVRTQQAIALPPEITLSFPVTDVPNLQTWINQARAHGHEVMLEIPMEPKTFPIDDPGPDALLANAKAEDIWAKLDRILARQTGYFAVTNYQGGKFLASNAAMDAFSTGLRRRGLAFIDDGQASQRGGGIPRASAERGIDEPLGRDSITMQLGKLEDSAKAHGSALGAGFGYSVTIELVKAWAQGLAARGIQLAPASALTVRR